MTSTSSKQTTGASDSNASARQAYSQFEHFVHFYASDDYLSNAVGDFIAAGYDTGQACIVIARPDRTASVERRLLAAGVDVAGARSRGLYHTFDAADTLSRIMRDGTPDVARFHEVIGGVIAGAAQGRSYARIFGEMVALLWADGQRDAAVRMEGLWNELRGASTVPFILYCAYPMRYFAGQAHAERFAAICGHHARVIPEESYPVDADPDERARVISALQQKAASLEREVAQRKDAEQRLRLIAECMPQKIFTATPTGEVNYFNPQWMEFTGLSFDDIKGSGWTRIIHPDDVEENVRAWRHSVKTGEPYEIEHRIRRDDGSYSWHVSRAVPMRDDHGDITMWIGSSTDINDQKQLEARKNAFISMASHELKTPITSLKGFAQILQRRLQREDVDPQTFVFLERMEAQLGKLTNLISDMLDISRMQSGMLPFRYTTVDLDTLVRETVENVQAATATHTLRLEGETHALVRGDPDRLEQALINLLTNAVKYSPNADKVEVRLCADHERAEVAVADHGIGIAKEDQARIFEQFYQVADPTGITYSGLGIGLYITRALIDRHSGRMWLESQKGVGSVFHFSLPILTEEPTTTDSPMRSRRAR